MKKLSGWKTKGMNRDLSVSAFNPEFAFENMNLRLSTNEGNTTLSWVNEKGTSALGLMLRKDEGEPVIGHGVFYGICIGTAVLNEYLVLFITQGEANRDKDCIYRLQYVGNNFMEVKQLYAGNLNFRPDHPLETMVSYEAEDIQKVYWTDAINTIDEEKWNQPRVINIVSDSIRENLDFQFDFIPKLQLKERVYVKKVTGGGGMFAPGVIQYAFTYYFKHGQETNIFYTTPLIYISHIDRGASPEDKVDNIFKIKVLDVDTNFDFLRIYSIQRTSINSTPICKRIQDIDLTNREKLDLVVPGDETKGVKVSFTDVGTTGNSVDPTELLYKGGSPIAVGTIEQKDNTLFMGDIATPRMDDLTELVKSHNVILEATKRSFYPIQTSTGDYDYANQLNSYNFNNDAPEGYSVPCAGFKYGNKYRCGLQFQDEWGRWTTPVWLDDITIKGDVHPSIVKTDGGGGSGEEGGDDELGDDIQVTVHLHGSETAEAINISKNALFILDDGTKLAVELEPHDKNIDNPYSIAAGETTGRVYDATVINGRNYIGQGFASHELYSSMHAPCNLVLMWPHGNSITYVVSTVDDLYGKTLREGGLYAVTANRMEVMDSQFDPTPTPAQEEDPVIPDPGGDTPVDPTPSGSDAIKFRIHNTTGQQVLLCGRMCIHVTQGDTTSWSSYKQIYCNVPNSSTTGSDGYQHWYANRVTIVNNGYFEWTADIASSDLAYANGSWKFISVNKDEVPSDIDEWTTVSIPAIIVYVRIFNNGIDETTGQIKGNQGSTGIYRLVPLQNTVFKKGMTYELELNKVHPEASLTNTSAHYYIYPKGIEAP